MTLVPILAAVYFYDLHQFFKILTSPEQGAFLGVAASLFVFGVLLKRKILRTRLELAGTSVPWGLLFLGLAVTLYVYGSYSTVSIWYHYESLLSLVTAYVAFRMGASVLRSLAALLAVFALALPTFLVSVLPAFPSGASVVVWSSAASIIILMFLYVRFRVKPITIPVAVLCVGAAIWQWTTYSKPGLSADFLLLIPAPLLALLVPRILKLVSLPSGASVPNCSGHHLFSDGFCSVCGAKVARARTGENSGFWGLVAVLTVAALLIATSIPVLAIAGGVPQTSDYTARGFTNTAIPAIPSGWQVNSSVVLESGTVTSLNFTSDVYAIQQVLVPIYHPEVANYTVAFELSPVTIHPYSNLSAAYSGIIAGLVPGWSGFGNNFTTVGPFQGYLTGYVGPGEILLLFQGQAPMYFLTGGQAQQYSVGAGFARVFKNSNTVADTTQFLADLNAFWISAFSADNSYSGTGNFLYTLYLETVPTIPLALLLSSIACVGWVAYQMTFRDDRLDRFLNLAANEAGDEWRELSSLLGFRHHSGTGQEIRAAAGGTGRKNSDSLDSSLRNLERKRLVRRSIVERGADAILVWRTVV